MNESNRRRGIALALTAALLFGGSTPFAKLLLAETPPVLLAGLLYCGSGVGLFALRLLTPGGVSGARLGRRDLTWLAGAVLSGGVVGPILLMWGLGSTPASTASLLLNLEVVFTAALAWSVFRENFGRRAALGMALLVASGVVISWPAPGTTALPAGALAVAGACLCWAIDNNLTQKVSGGDALQIAAVKGLVAGSVNLTIAFAVGARAPSTSLVAGAMTVGFFGYGISLTLFVVALRHLGAARTGAYFSVAPFAGTVVSLMLFDEPLRSGLVGAAILMGLGVWLMATERHDHAHAHGNLVHSHPHYPDLHHRHH